MAHQPGQDLQDLRPDDQLVVVGAVLLGHGPRVGKLVEGLLLEANGKGFHRPPRQLAHEGDDQAAVDAAAQEGAQGNIGNESQADRLLENLEEALDGLLLVQGVFRGVIQLPVRDGLGRLQPLSVRTRTHDQVMGRRQLEDRAEDGVAARECSRR